METLLDELNAGFPDLAQIVRLLVRLGIAMLLGAVVGFQRERYGKPAGLRTPISWLRWAAHFLSLPPSSPA